MFAAFYQLSLFEMVHVCVRMGQFDLSQRDKYTILKYSVNLVQ